MECQVILTHSVVGSINISTPDGWKTAMLTRERHPDFHCLVKSFKTNFSLYGNNGIDNGGRDFFKSVQAIGLDEDIEVDFQIRENEWLPWEIIFSGLLPIVGTTEILDFDHNVQVPFMPNSLWSKFLNRYDTPVNIFDNLDLDGNPRVIASAETLNCLPQKIRQVYSAFCNTGFIQYNPVSIHDLIQFDFDTITLDEITTRFSTIGGSLPDGSLANPQFVCEFGGNYRFQIQIQNSAENGPGEFEAGSIWMQWVIQKNNEASLAFAFVDHTGTSLPSPDRVITTSTIDQSFDLLPGDQIKIYAVMLHTLGNGSTTDAYNVIVWGNTGADGFDSGGAPVHRNYVVGFVRPTPSPTWIIVTANTIKDTTQAQALLIHDVGCSILDRIVGQDLTLQSNYLGNPHVQLQEVGQYTEDGNASNYVAVQGLQVRGYLLGDKIFSKSAKDWWEGLDPHFNLCLFEQDGKIKVEQKKKVYDDSEMSIILTNVNKIKKTYDKDVIYSSVQMGSSKWESAAAQGTSGGISGLDDPQTKTTWALLFKHVGKLLTIVSSWISASYTFELTRRTSIIKSANYTYDNDTFLVNVVRQDDGNWNPALDENFSSVTNLLNEETRYNKILTPARALLRWMNVISGCVQDYSSSVLKFVAGEGNYNMTATTVSTDQPEDFGGANVAENGDYPVSSEFLHRPEIFEIDHVMTADQWKSYDANPNLCIGITQTEINPQKFFVKTIDWSLLDDGAVHISGWFKEKFDIVITQTESARKIFSDDFDDSFE